MKNILLVLVTLLLASCASNNDVVRSGFLQKRKYKKGYTLSFKKKIKTQHHKEVELLALTEKDEDLKKEKGVKKAKSDEFGQQSKVELELSSSQEVTASLVSGVVSSKSPFLKEKIDKYNIGILEKLIDKRDDGVSKILIKKIKTFTLITVVSFLAYAIVAVLATLNANIVLSLLALGLIIILLVSFFSAIRSLIKYINYKFLNKEDLSSSERRKLGYAKRLNALSKILLLLLALFLIGLLLLVFAPVAIQSSLLFVFLFFVVTLHYVVFLVFTIVSFLILLILATKEMRADLGSAKKNSDDYYYE